MTDDSNKCLSLQWSKVKAWSEFGSPKNFGWPHLSTLGSNTKYFMYNYVILLIIALAGSILTDTWMLIVVIVVLAAFSFVKNQFALMLVGAVAFCLLIYTGSLLIYVVLCFMALCLVHSLLHKGRSSDTYGDLVEDSIEQELREEGTFQV